MGGKHSAAPGPALFFALYAPFVLNDFVNIHVGDFVPWLLLDYAMRTIPVIAAVILARRGVLDWSDLGFRRMPWPRFIVWALAASAAGLFLDQQLFDRLTELMPWWKLGKYPIDETHWLYGFDLIFGLILVAFSEEIVSRGLAASVFGPRIGNTVIFYVVTSLLFGLAHWSHGPGPILATSAIGAVFMFVLRRTGSIWPVIVAHFVVNFWYFS